jgi:hypothetical protein
MENKVRYIIIMHIITMHMAWWRVWRLVLTGNKWKMVPSFSVIEDWVPPTTRIL